MYYITTHGQRVAACGASRDEGQERKMSAVENFESIATELVRVAPNEKAAAFAKKVADQIRARGASWIGSNVETLKIQQPADKQFFPVADNRMFFLTEWQSALIK